MSAPVTLYSPDGKRTREIAAIDSPGWIQAGWSKSPVVVAATPAEVASLPEPTPVEIASLPEPTPAAQPQTKYKRNDISRDGVPEN
ncbi:hypothetical protein FD723_18785 [Nostoc sp. C052]|uniref:hypothetical protein n=1 Tax=Nostoc sp. C052 TaxID=2576902 RepID=UPI0015C401BD|nr:hypothetical protein [Nostoc sp. C052]QLE42267.1 hypothetical protein FD723_18785 [Nostoc sp. C052]